MIDKAQNWHLPVAFLSSLQISSVLKPVIASSAEKHFHSLYLPCSHPHTSVCPDRFLILYYYYIFISISIFSLNWTLFTFDILLDVQNPRGRVDHVSLLNKPWLQITTPMQTAMNKESFMPNTITFSLWPCCTGPQNEVLPLTLK